MQQATVNWKDCIEYAEVSDIGMRRANNQDARVVALASDLATWEQRGHCFTVADGMGAHAAGELASELAVDNVPHTYLKLLELSPSEALEEAVREANNLIYTRGQETLEFRGMGTTCSTLVLLPAGALVAHVGDSRVYRLRGAKLDQLTCDHSLLWETIAAAKRTGLAPPQNVPPNVITRSLGPKPNVDVDLEGPFPVEVGDVYLICSDGLTGPVDDEEIGAILSCLSLQDAVQTLVDMANLRGGPDNITVIGVSVTGPLAAGGEAGVAPSEVAADRRVHPVVWAVMALCLVGASAFGATGRMLAAAVSLLMALVALGVALVRNFGGRASAGAVGPTELLGAAPYRTYESQPTKKLSDSLAEMVVRLREAADRESWQLDWQAISSHFDEAEAAAARHDHAAAVAQYANGLRSILHQLRNDLMPPGNSNVLF